MTKRLRWLAPAPETMADFIAFTTDEDGEAEVVAEIRRNGVIEARSFQGFAYNQPTGEPTPGFHHITAFPSRHKVEWKAIGGPGLETPWPPTSYPVAREARVLEWPLKQRE